ncbi:hypothetical protein C9374_014298 [Naegleria lovaniensis]|uniref:Uncharacterized protein n=1 Tax=Naegleria lovaniensis TaxID=51637 RepID=A0AA88KDI4_NAELO|nr:uncharacterized protein C9374_014298 [Naegleria lovaniensis]KAG2370707.1 hypothetical protein C9374_014298 [Naegleria lovaniensis]
MDHLTILADKNTKKTEKKKALEDLSDLLGVTKKIELLSNILFRTLSPEECTSQFCNSPSEMACSASYCQPLFEFCALFDNCYRNMKVSIGEYTMLPESLKFMRNIIGTLKPDDVAFHKPGKRYYISMLREDKVTPCKHHLEHPDLPKLALMCRISHSFCMRELLSDIQEPWYKDIATIGITTDKEKANVYAVSTDIATTRRRNCKLDYSIRYLGTFYHNQITHRIQLIALILTAMKNLHHQEMAAYLRTKSVTSNSTIGSAEKSFKKNLEVRIGRNCYNISIGKTISDNKNKLVIKWVT